MAIRRREDILKRSREMKRKRRSLRRIVFVVIVVVLIAASFFILSLDTFTIKSVLVRGSTSVPSGDIELLAHKTIAGSYAYTIPRSSIFVYPRTTLITHISALSPRIVSVQVHISATRILVIDISERTPRYLWCGDSPDCVYLDEGGFAFARAFTDLALPYPIFTMATSTPALNQTILDQHRFIPLARFIDTLPLKVQRVHIEGDRSDITVASGYRIIVDAYTDFAAARRNLLVALSRPEFTIPFSRGEVLQYIDLRIPQKVFYKF